ncbi:MAG: hypothetical protein IKA60_03225 [Rikenellaceae bacterium]|nr:hypothetical protein [Rikenellaceae bacterium]MBR2333324.1 hypothetical protein [Rikenellaceae bacterium]MBR2443028.1 hypothetical protein [Rikenellaceae bacterium]
MTIYQRELKERIASHYADMSSDQLIDLLFDMGVVDHTRCKVLAVRDCVEEMVRAGRGKVDAMYQAAERFACSYEYVRKCMYYYTDVNMVKLNE